MTTPSAKAIRTQVDGKGDEYSLLASTNYEGQDNTSVTRQEFGKEADINNIVARFGANAFSRDHTYGEIDYDQTLASRLAMVNDARNQYNALPQSIRDKYPFGSDVMIQALADGSMGKDIDTANKPPEPPAPPTPKPTP